MGIRFACHVCQRRLNIKRELAGRRGICPVCAARIRIPLDDCESSTPVDETQLTAVCSPGPVGSPDQPPGNAPSDWHTGDAKSDAPVTTDVPVTPDVPAKAVDDESPAGADSEAIDVLAEQPEATWYVRPPSGGQYGPATAELLRQWIREGRVAATALLWKEGWPQWRDASEVLPQYADRLPASGPTIPDATPVTSGPELRNTVDPQGRRGPAATKVPPRSKWTRAIMTIGLLSVLALSLILVLAFAVLR